MYPLKITRLPEKNGGSEQVSVIVNKGKSPFSRGAGTAVIPVRISCLSDILTEIFFLDQGA